MNERKQHITLNIGGKPYTLDVYVDKEEFYRLAERKVNDYVRQLTAGRYNGFTAVDYMALAALCLAEEGIEAAAGRRVQSEDVQRLAELARLLDRTLEK